MRLNNFENLFADQLVDLYSAEIQLSQALPKMAEAASSPELKQAFTRHLEETKRHAETVKQLLTAMGEEGGEKCKGMEGLLKEGQEIIDKRGDAAVKDAALIASAQRVEHYEISGYGTARAMAQQLGNSEAANRLQQIMEQESRTDELLTQIAMNVQSGMAEMKQQGANGNNSRQSR
jgi:ferritin-like metal-binding protein YciE